MHSKIKTNQFIRFDLVIKRFQSGGNRHLNSYAACTRKQKRRIKKKKRTAQKMNDFRFRKKVQGCIIPATIDIVQQAEKKQ